MSDSLQPAGEPPLKVPVPPEVVRQALSDFDEKEILEAIREIRETGGLTLADFLPELEQLCRPR